jgi:hypothetical protein
MNFSEYISKDSYWLIFFYDILVYSQSLDDHLKHLKVVFELLITHQLVAKVSRCVFCNGKVEYLGHIISWEGVATDPHKIKAIVEWTIPKNIKQLRGFLGLIGYYIKFVKGYESFCKLLTQLFKRVLLLPVKRLAIYSTGRNNKCTSRNLCMNA